MDERPSLFPVWRSRPVQASRLCIGEDTVRFGIDTNGDAGLDASGLDRNKGPLVPDEGKLWPSEDATLIVRCGDATLLVPTACLGLRGGAALENLGEVLHDQREQNGQVEHLLLITGGIILRSILPKEVAGLRFEFHENDVGKIASRVH